MRGAEQFLALSKRCKAVAPELRKELNKGVRKAVKPVTAATRAEARKILPRSGGLADRVARAPQRARIRTGSSAGVSIVVGGKGAAARSTDEGTVRHPVFGNKSAWVVQSVTPGWFTEPAKAEAPAVRDEIKTVMDDVARKVAGR